MASKSDITKERVSIVKHKATQITMDEDKNVKVRAEIEKILKKGDSKNRENLGELCHQINHDFIYGKHYNNEHFNIDEFYDIAEEVLWDLEYCDVCKSSPCTCNSEIREV
jgi:hypothetical protein